MQATLVAFANGVEHTSFPEPERYQARRGSWNHAGLSFSGNGIKFLCELYTHKHSTCRVAQHNHISSSLRIAHLFPQSKCHPRVMSHSLPNLTLTPSTSSLLPFSATSPICPTVSPSQTSTMNLNPHIPWDGPRHSGGSTQIPSLTDFEPKTVEFKHNRRRSDRFWRPQAPKN